MRVLVQPSVKDRLLVEAHLLRRIQSESKPGKLLNLLSYVAFASFAFGWLKLLSAVLGPPAHARTESLWAIWLISGAALPTLGYLLAPRSAKKAITNVDDEMLLPIDIEIRFEGLVASTTQETSLYFWSAIQEIADTAEYIYVHLSPRQAIPIPIRSFASREDHRRFLAALRAKATSQSSDG